VTRCPACGFENDDASPACARCHLGRALFDPVAEAAGRPDSHPQYLKTIGEILAAVDAPESGADELAPSAAVLASPARFPSIAAPLPASPAASEGPAAPSGFPALPPAGDLPVLLRQVNDFLLLARRQGLDLTDFGQRARDAVLAQDRDTLEVLSRDLFVHLAASITEEYENLLQRRNEMSGLVATASVDVELESCRASLAMGDLAGAQRRLRHVDQQLGDLEDHWATVQILVAECDLLASTIRDLGGDPEPALGPLAEGRRLARDGDREAAEPVLARAALALWTVLEPSILHEIAGIKDTILRQRGRGTDVGAAVAQFRQLAADLRHRNFAAAIAAYRQLRQIAGHSGAEPGAGVAQPSAVGGPG
jgi:hypothetical protein